MQFEVFISQMYRRCDSGRGMGSNVIHPEEWSVCIEAAVTEHPLYFERHE